MISTWVPTPNVQIPYAGTVGRMIAVVRDGPLAVAGLALRSPLDGHRTTPGTDPWGSAGELWAFSDRVGLHITAVRTAPRSLLRWTRGPDQGPPRRARRGRGEPQTAKLAATKTYADRSRSWGRRRRAMARDGLQRRLTGRELPTHEADLRGTTVAAAASSTCPNRYEGQRQIGRTCSKETPTPRARIELRFRSWFSRDRLGTVRRQRQCRSDVERKRPQ